MSFYFYDIVYNDTFEEHMKTLEKVLCIFKKANMKLRPTKCQKEIQFIGHKIRGGYLIPVSYASRKLLDREQRYPITEK